MPSVRFPRLATAARSGRVVGLLTALLLATNATVVAGAWSDGGNDHVAAAAVALAAGAEVDADIDPLAGLSVRVALPAGAGEATALPVPEPPPADAYAPTPEVRHGQLEIPAIGVSQPLFEGVTLTAINRGPSHWPGTAMPGELGNVVVAGHRTTYTKPFWALNELVPGDELVFTVGGERIVYVLERLEIVEPTDVHIVDQSAEKRATLFACHPRGSARQRIVGHFVMAPTMLDIELSDSMRRPVTGIP